MAGQSASEIKARISGIADTKKITDAMYMIASSKMRKAVKNLEQTTPYFDALTDKIGELFHYIPSTENRYFKGKPKDTQEHQNHGILLITSDKGLAGAYNQTAIKVAQEYMKRHPKTTLFIIGEYGRQYFKSKKIDFVTDFCYSPEHPSLTVARRICAELLEYYNDSRLDDINIIYTEYMGNRPCQCKELPLLPLSRTKFYREDEDEKGVEKEFLPSPDEVLEGVIPSYLTGFIYSSLVDSYCSEQQVRMMAMKGASDNAEKILKALKLEYNELRQAAITGEMIEIASGAKALKQKRNKSAQGEY